MVNISSTRDKSATYIIYKQSISIKGFRSLDQLMGELASAQF